MSEVDGVILAGGRSSRMGGRDKSGCLIAGVPMIDWVVRATQPQVRRLAINSNGPGHAFARLGLPVLPDRTPGFRGPLMGLYSAMSWCTTDDRPEWLAVFSCDMPFLPDTLVTLLKRAAEDEARPAAVIALEGELQPTASLWRTDLLGRLREAVEGRQIAGFKRFLDDIPYARVELDASWTACFFNVNSPAELACAQQMAERRLC